MWHVSDSGHVRVFLKSALGFKAGGIPWLHASFHLSPGYLPPIGSFLW